MADRVIENIVFDIGNVLLDWNPEYLFRTILGRDDYYTHPISSIVGGPVWHEMDRGTVGPDEAVEITSRGNEEYRGDIEKFMKGFPELLQPIAESVSCAEECRRMGMGTYLLSNFPEYAYRKVYSKYSFFSRFSGGIISWEVKKIKPEPEIYEILLDKYNLDPAGTLFIDDMEENLKQASKLGIRTMHMKDNTDILAEIKHIINSAEREKSPVE